MVYLLNFNISCIIILATCFDSYELSSDIISRTIVHIVLQFLSKTQTVRQKTVKQYVK